MIQKRFFPFRIKTLKIAMSLALILTFNISCHHQNFTLIKISFIRHFDFSTKKFCNLMSFTLTAVLFSLSAFNRSIKLNLARRYEVIFPASYTSYYIGFTVNLHSMCLIAGIETKSFLPQGWSLTIEICVLALQFADFK